MSQLNNNIYNYIKENNGLETLKTVRKLEKTVKKLARFRNHLTFAMRCKTSHVQPKGLRLKGAMKTQKTKNIVATAERKLLQEHIHDVVKTIRTIKNEMRRYQERLSGILSDEVYRRLEEMLVSREHGEFEKVKTRQKNKFLRLVGVNTYAVQGDNVNADQDGTSTDDPSVVASGATGPAEETVGSVSQMEEPVPDTTSADRTADRSGGMQERPEGRRNSPTSQHGLTVPANGPVPPSHAEETTPDGTGGLDSVKDKWVVNLSGKPLSDAELGVLRKGLNFVPAPKHVDNVEFITEVEKMLAGTNMPPDEANRVRFEVTKALQGFKPRDDNLTKEERRALRSLQGRDDLMFLPSDKGKSVCVLTKEQYRSKVEDLLEDGETYEELQGDPTLSYTRKVRGALKSIETKGNLTRGQYLQLYPSDPLPPLFYGLPKVHKPDVPLRPIVSMVGSVTYDIAKHLAPILAPLVGNSECHVRNSADFVQFARTLSLAEDETMVSFDVKSLFTSVPTDEACDIARSRLEAEMEREESRVRALTGMDVEDIVFLLKLCLNTTYFQVNNKFYHQKQGAAMGSPVSVIVANLFMEELEKRALESFGQGVRVWRRYVDDTFVVVKKEQVGALHRHLNNQSDGISFTVEEEREGTLAFLDVEVTRGELGSLKTAVFRKATHTDKYLDFMSHHSVQHKESVVRSLVRRGDSFPSDETGRARETSHIDRTLGANNYPKRFVNRTRRKMLAGRARTQEDQGEERKPVVVLPYVQGVTERVTRALAPYAKVANKPGRNLRSMLVKPKDKREKISNAGVVYQYECICRKVYIGETGRSIKTRESEHKRAIRNGEDNHSGISKHVLETGHSIKWEEVKILAYETNWRKRKIKEGIFIAKTNESTLMNTRPGVPMNDLYRVI